MSRLGSYFFLFFFFSAIPAQLIENAQYRRNFSVFPMATKGEKRRLFAPAAYCVRAGGASSGAPARSSARFFSAVAEEACDPTWPAEASRRGGGGAASSCEGCGAKAVAAGSTFWSPPRCSHVLTLLAPAPQMPPALLSEAAASVTEWGASAGGAAAGFACAVAPRRFAASAPATLTAAGTGRA